MGFNVIDSTATNVKVKGIAGVAISAGDLVSNNESGYLTKSTAMLGIGFENNTTAGLSAIRAITSIEGTTGYSSNTSSGVTGMNTLCELGNGNIAMVYSGNGAIGTTGLNLRIRNVLGADIIAKVTVSSFSGIYGCRVNKLNSSKFVVTWPETGALKFQIFNNDGSTSSSVISVDSLSGSTAFIWNITTLPNGNIVFAYDIATTNNLVLAVYDTTGTLVGSKVTTLDTGSIPSYIGLLACSNGDFVVRWYRGNATTGEKIARFTWSGSAWTQVGSTYVNPYTASLSYANWTDTLCELSNGSVVGLLGGTSSYPAIVVLSNTMTVVKAAFSLAIASGILLSGEAPMLMSLLSGGFAIIGRTSGGTMTLMTFDSLGQGILTKIGIISANWGSYISSYGNGISAFPLGGIGYALLKITYDNSQGLYSAELVVLKSDGTVVNNIVLKASAGTNVYNRAAILTSGGILVGMYEDQASPYLADFYYNVSRRSILGVAAESVSANQAVNVLTKGTLTINQNFTSGGSFDTTAATIPGTKGAIIGTTAILRGTL